MQSHLGSVQRYQNDMMGFIPYGARSREEYAIREEFTNKDGRGVFMMVLIVAKDGGTVLRAEILREAVKNGFIVQRGLLAANVSLSERISLGYPVTELYGRRVNIQPNFHGVVSLNNTMMNSTEIDEGDSSILISNMVFAKMLTLLYREERTGDWTDKQVTDYELSIVNYFQRVYQPEFVQIFVVNFSYIDYEITRAGLSMLPYLIVGFAIMSVCSTLSTLISAAYMQQISFHKSSPIVARATYQPITWDETGFLLSSHLL
uniref:Ionotropic glutamate receptor C-terminal domain-containing protein n=1 Tax=Parascaris univalens TaxID=6257 RepID=A0A915BQB3_PARUN